MLTIQTHDCGVDGLVDRLKSAVAPNADLVRHIIAHTCTRLQVLKNAGKPTNVDQLIEAGAWCDVALTLIDIELPGWNVRRLVREDGDWFCSLSSQPNLPVALDDTADASHNMLPLAIIGAFLEARRRISDAREPDVPIVPQVHPASCSAICCDNFA